jgi:predicted nucleic acid-binding Zn ribbon protein
MPLFDFKCPSCGTVREVLIISEEIPLPVCVHDGVKWMMLRQPSAPAFHIKGYSAANGYTGTTREISKAVHKQADMRVSVKEG